MTLELTHFSFSGISMFKSCPRSFEYKYIRKIAEAFSSIEAHMGSSVHETLEWAYSQRKDGYESTIESALQQYKYCWDKGDFSSIKIVKDDKKPEDYYFQGRDFLISYFRRIFPNDKSQTVYLEHEFQINLNERIVYRGIIDRIAKKEDGTIRIIDYKTGKVDQPLDTLQLPSYALYIFEHNIDPEVELCYEDLRSERTNIARFTRKDARMARESLLNDIEVIINSKAEDFVTNPSILCLWCGYNHICDNPHEFVKKLVNMPDAKLDANQIDEPVQSNPTGSTPVENGEYQEACPLCGGELKEKKGKYGNFMGCTNYPECRYTRNIGFDQRNAAADPNIEGKDVCPECGGLLKQRQGRYGDFIGCSNYPNCRFTRKI